jgi:DNA-directed RNA polymerase omega subunit
MAEQMIDETEEITEINRSSDGNALINSQEIDSKYRMIILAAQRSKQLQRGATPRVDADPRKTKPTRIAMKELETGKVNFETFTESQYSTKQ